MSEEFTLPDWINVNIFRELFKQEKIDLAKIIKFRVTAGSSTGENYITRILRVVNEMRMKDGSVQCCKLILKIPFHNSVEHDYEYHELFVNEMEMYDKIIPAIAQTYKAIDVPIIFASSSFKLSVLHKQDYILLQDLTYANFMHISCIVGLDYKHTRYVLAKLAKWHAGSVRYVEIVGPYAVNYRNSYFTLEHQELIASMNNAFSLPFADCLQSYDLTATQKLKIQNYLPYLTDLYLKFGQVNETHFNVLNHGDMWINNIMFHYNAATKDIDELLFLDFQLPKYGTPAQDLFSLLMTSPQMDIRLERFDEFISYYHEELVKSLSLLNCQQDKPELSDIYAALKADSVWGFVCVQRLLAIGLLDVNESTNYETFMSNNKEGVGFKKRMFYNPRYVEQITKILVWFVEREFLEI